MIWSVHEWLYKNNSIYIYIYTYTIVYIQIHPDLSEQLSTLPKCVNEEIHWSKFLVMYEWYGRLENSYKNKKVQEQAEKWRKETSEGDRVDESGLVSEVFMCIPLWRECSNTLGSKDTISFQ